MSTCPACEDCGQPQEGPAPGIGYWCTNDACPGIERAREWMRWRITARFTISDDGRFINDNDFGYDAQLELTGDFINEHRLQYAKAVAAALNAIPPPIAPKDYDADSG